MDRRLLISAPENCCCVMDRRLLISAPENCCLFLPRRYAWKVGMDRICCFADVSRLKLTSTFANTALPLYCFASCLKWGAIIRQGPHPFEKKSTMTGSPVTSL